MQIEWVAPSTNEALMDTSSYTDPQLSVFVQNVGETSTSFIDPC